MNELALTDLSETAKALTVAWVSLGIGTFLSIIIGILFKNSKNMFALKIVASIPTMFFFGIKSLVFIPVYTIVFPVTAAVFLTADLFMAYFITWVWVSFWISLFNREPKDLKPHQGDDEPIYTFPPVPQPEDLADIKSSHRGKIGVRIKK